MRRLIAFLLLLLLGTAGSVGAAEPASSSASGQAPVQPPSQETPPQGPKDTPAATKARTQADPPVQTFTVSSFQTDLFTGAATSEIPVLVPPGTAGVAPQIVLRYNSSVVDGLGGQEQGQGTGLGWSLDTGGFVLRDTKNTTSPSDDTFKLVLGGVSHELIAVDGSGRNYHTKDETFWLIEYTPTADYWTVKTKDGATHRFGFNTDSKAIALGQDLVTEVTWKYLLDEVKTTSGTSVRYSYVKQTATASATGRSYDQAVYPSVITYTYYRGSLVGPLREVRFVRSARSDFTDTSATTNVSFLSASGLMPLRFWWAAVWCAGMPFLTTTPLTAIPTRAGEVEPQEI